MSETDEYLEEYETLTKESQNAFEMLGKGVYSKSDIRCEQDLDKFVHQFEQLEENGEDGWIESISGEGTYLTREGIEAYRAVFGEEPKTPPEPRTLAGKLKLENLM